jgi:hypothetical protein
MKKLFPISLTLVLVFILTVFSFGQQSNAAPDSKYYVYVANVNDSNISAYSIIPRTGALSEIKGSLFPLVSLPTP